ncbi:uncharacterized protein NPIL_27111 [Nephila pilipes]|uniref:Uncharacterized protein n=1 Tax=Nephila pilipes TaxID=299642 RepID=A0A8X6QHX8_NEPPI|nr:uncharacterized protein NPIL_27111 [Nephila pilipes]
MHYDLFRNLTFKMEASADGCPTGILVDFAKEINTQDLREIRVYEGNKGEVHSESYIEKEMNIKSSCLWAVNNIQNQNANPRLFSEKYMLHSSKSKWNTPSPESMKIISHEASQIIDKLSTSTDMLCDEVFPAIKSLDDACFDEINLKSESFPVTNNFACEKMRENNFSIGENLSVIKSKNDNSFNELVKSGIVSEDYFPCDKITGNNLLACENISPDNLESNSHDVIKCKPSIEENSGSSDCFTKLNKRQLTTPLESEMIAEVVSEEIPETLSLAENRCKKETLVLNKGSNLKMKFTASVDQNPIFEQTEILVDSHPEPKFLSSLQVKPNLKAFKGFGFKSFPKLCAEKNKKNLMQQAENKCPVTGITEMEKASVSVDEEFKKLKISDKIINNKPIIKQSSRKSIAALAVSSENRKCKSVMNANQRCIPSETFGKSSYKSNIVQQPSICSKQSLGKSESLRIGTPVVKSVRRSNSFQTGCAKNSIPTVERKSIIPAASSCSRVLKPKISLNTIPNNGKGLSTPLRYGTNLQNAKIFNSAATNPNRRTSGIYHSSDIKAPIQNVRNSILQKPVVSTSSRSRFSSRLDRPSPLPKFMNDNLPRKLF